MELKEQNELLLDKLHNTIVIQEELSPSKRSQSLNSKIKQLSDLIKLLKEQKNKSQKETSDAKDKMLKTVYIHNIYIISKV